MSLILPMENKENTVTLRNSPQTALFSPPQELEIPAFYHQLLDN